MTRPKHQSDKGMTRLARVLLLTRAGMFAESVTRAFWPLWSLCFGVLAALMMGAQDHIGLETLWGLGVGVICLGGWLMWSGMRKLAWPTKNDALLRLDATLPGRPLQALRDQPAIGAHDAGAQAVWAAHQARMREKAAAAEPVQPDLRVARLDPFGLRFVAVIALVVAFLFGSVGQVRSVIEMTSATKPVASGPAWEGWVEPPLYTGKPALYLNDLPAGQVVLAQNSRILVRLYGEVGALTLSETVSGRTDDIPSAAEPEQEFVVVQSGVIVIDGPNGRRWDIEMTHDMPPAVVMSGQAEASARGEMSLPFAAEDDYEVISGVARIGLDLGSLDRRYGLALAPETQAEVLAQLPMPIAGDRAVFEGILIEDYSAHVWAHMHVTIELRVEDALDQMGRTEPAPMLLPARRFFDPFAAAIVEMRRDILWNRKNAPRVAQLIRAMSHRPQDGMFPDKASYLRLRTIMRRLEGYTPAGLTDAQQTEISDALWDLALMLEEGDLGDAFARMKRAQERLSEAMKNGASDAEIAQLMQELRDATQDYLRELARRNSDDDPDGQTQSAENTMTLSQDDLQRMMDHIQDLMEQGRMAEAQQALQEFQEMMENMQVTQGQGGSELSPGEQAMQDLAGTLKDQQGLSDQAFRELQEQFNPNANRGQSQDNEGYSGGQGRGESHDGTGQGSAEQGDTGTTGPEPGQQPGQGALADRQQALRQQLDALEGNVPGQGTPEGDAAREALGRAGDAMENAEQALRENDLAEAIDQQAQAMDAMREGIRNLGDALAQQQGQGGQSDPQQARRGSATDPLGRSPGARGPAGTQDGLLQGEDVYRQARRLLDEIRKRAGQSDRPVLERNYLKRLLDRF